MSEKTEITDIPKHILKAEAEAKAHRESVRGQIAKKLGVSVQEMIDAFNVRAGQ